MHKQSKTKMKTPIYINSKGNEVITWCSFNVWSCLLLSSHCHYMWCCCQCSLQYIYANQVNNDDIHQGSEAISNNKDIHSSLGTTREKVGYLPLNMCSTLQNNNCDNISKCIVGYCTFILEKAPKQMGTLTTLTSWKMGYHRMWQAKTNM
jgi:hypothetical protein